MEREELMQRFGPKLIEAIMKEIREELDEIRAKIALTPKSEQDFIDGISEKLNNIEDYSWRGVK